VDKATLQPYPPGPQDPKDPEDLFPNPSGF
jgi:hypothetical protein